MEPVVLHLEAVLGKGIEIGDALIHGELGGGKALIFQHFAYHGDVAIVNMTVSDYVTQAGGYGFRSKKSKAYVVYMNGTVAKAKKLSKNVVEPGCEIVIPQKREKKANLANILGISTTAASLATMVATIGNIIR